MQISPIKKDSSNCNFCNKGLLFLIGGTRCSICSKLYKDFKYCDGCIAQKNYSFRGKKYKILCGDCLNIIKSSANEVQSEIQKIPLPNENSVKLMQFYEESKSLSDSLIKRNPLDDYILGKKISGGSYGQVYQISEKVTKAKFAVKIIRLQSSDLRVLALNEYSLTKLCDHPNIIQYHCIYKYKKEIWIIQELMKLSLTSILSRAYPLPEKIIVYILKQVLHGIIYIHSRHRIHRDIKSDNILLGLNGSIKICDLGFAAQLTSERQERSTLAGSTFWLAPEIMNSKNYNLKVDVWSYGILAVELIEGEPPMFRSSPEELKKAFEDPQFQVKFEERVGKPLIAMISNCLIVNPNLRKSALDLLEEEVFFDTINSEEYMRFINERYQLLI